MRRRFKTTLIAMLSILISCPASHAVSLSKEMLLEHFKFEDGQPKNSTFNRTKPWDECEKAKIKRSLDEICEKSKGLLELASCFQDVSLYRVSEQRFKTLLRDSSPSPAFSDNSKIFFTDSFFADESAAPLSLELTHELAHLADRGSHLSYSREWIWLNQPRIAEVRELVAETDVKDYFSLETLVRNSHLLPRLEAAASLRETFAYCISEIIMRTGFVLHPRAIPIINRVLRPSNGDIEWNHFFSQGEKAFSANDYAD